VKGYVLKDSAVMDIVGSIKAIIEGQPYISPQLSAFLLNRGARREERRRNALGLDDLTPTERKILRMLADYKTSKQIADEMFISPRTVDNHRANITTKLGLRGSHALLKFAIEHKSEI
jgi:DNA-binding NarL/FixJ family response regulator